MEDRHAVFTTLNGTIVEWKEFDGYQEAFKEYNTGIERMRNIVKRGSEGDWQIMLCHVNQYALSKPQKSERVAEKKPEDSYAKYLNALAGQAKKLSGLAPRLTLTTWNKMKSQITKPKAIKDRIVP